MKDCCSNSQIPYQLPVSKVETEEGWVVHILHVHTHTHTVVVSPITMQMADCVKVCQAVSSYPNSHSLCLASLFHIDYPSQALHAGFVLEVALLIDPQPT